MNQKRTDFSTSTYSGADISVVATLNFASMQKAFLEEGSITKTMRSQKRQKQLSNLVYELGTVQTISCQSHRPKAPVRSIGRSYVKGYTRGPRTIAGSMVFTVLNKHSLRELCRHMEEIVGEDSANSSPTMLPDQLLPIDLTFLFANEYGSVSRMALYGVEFLNSGHTMSIEDLLLEEVLQFVARDMDPMADLADRNHAAQKGRPFRNLSATDIFKRSWPEYKKWLDRVNLRRRF